MWNIQLEFSVAAASSSTPEAHSQPVKCSSPFRPLQPTVDKRSSHIYHDTNTTLEPEEMLRKLYPVDSSDLPSLLPGAMTKNWKKSKSVYCDYLNKLSAKFDNPKRAYTLLICAAAH